jgi:tetratricopeptide (TPR) repeat protein
MGEPDKPGNAGAQTDPGPEARVETGRDEQREPAQTTMNGLWTRMRKHARVLAGAGLLLLAVAAAASVVWALRANKEAWATSEEAATERQHAGEAAKQAKEERAQVEAARQQAARERDDARADVEAATRTSENAKAVVAFLEDKLLSAGRLGGWKDGHWAGGPGKEKTLREAVDAAAREVAKTFADRPLVEAEVREVLGSAYLDLGSADLAVAQYESALALREAMLGPDHPDTVACRNQLARAERLAGRTAEAARLYERNPDTVSHAAALALRGRVLLSEKKAAEAEGKLRESLAVLQRIRPDEWTTFKVKSELGEALLSQKKYAEAEPLLLSGYRGLRQRRADIPPHDRACVTTALERIVRLYEAWGKKDEADKWRKELEKAG